jgi:hypothetical protein
MLLKHERDENTMFVIYAIREAIATIRDDGLKISDVIDASSM